MKNPAYFLLVCMLPLFCFPAQKTPRRSKTQEVKSRRCHETYAQVLTEALNRAVASELDGRMHLVDGNSGPMMWYYQNPNGLFNQQTFNYISRRVAGSSRNLAQLTEAGGFPNAYSLVLQLLSYNIGSADRARIQAAEAASQGFADSTIALYESAFGAITPAQMAAAFAQYGLGASGKMDYIIDVTMAVYWSGRSTGGVQPLTYSQMANAANLDSLLPLLPAAGKPALAMARKFMNNTISVASIIDSAQNAAWTLRQLKNNTQYPTGLNGGSQLVNPYDGSYTGYQVAYTIANPLSNLARDLQDASRRIVVTVTAHNTGGAYVNIVVNQGSGRVDSVSYNIPDSVVIDIDDTAMPPHTGTADIILTATFSRYSIVNTSPVSWNDTTNTGWYFDYPINEAVKHDTFDVTGYKFMLPPPYNMSSYEAGGTFGYLQQLLVCADMPQVKVRTGQQGPSATVMATPQAITVPQMQSIAYVVGGVFAFPRQR